MTFPSAEAGYGQIRRQTSSPVSAESQLLLQIAADLEACDRSSVEGYKVLAKAVKKNTDLWTAFVADIAIPENPLPAELKDGIVKLAAFSIAYGVRVLSNSADPAPLANVNRTVAAGLREQQQVAA